MARVSPLSLLHDAAGAVMAPYGPEGDGIPVVQVYSGIDREYAAIRKSAAILDLPQRAVLAVTGPDRVAFLNRMITQELKGIDRPAPPFSVRRSFWLNRKGRVDADLTVIGTPERIVLELDAHASKRALDGLSSFIIADDVKIEDPGEKSHRISVHGTEAGALLARVAVPAEGSPAVADLRPDQAGLYAGGAMLIWRHDSTGEPGFEVSLPAATAPEVYSLLAEPIGAVDGDRARAERGFELHERTASTGGGAVRAGWHAFNIARIEAGTPLYYLDFGPDSLPHETGPETLRDRVSFTKGCYLGQEIVARMQSLGHPKRRLVALEFPDGAETQPVTGSRITETADPAAEAIGAVTSSAVSPMLGSRPICFAMLKFKHATPGATVHVHADDGRVTRAAVRESIVHWTRGWAAAPTAGI